MDLQEKAASLLFISAFLFTATQANSQESGFKVHIDSGVSIRDHQLGHYYPMIDWDEGQYAEFAWWDETDQGSIVHFMNFRVSFPPGFDKNDTRTRYPAILMLHGAGESGRKWDGNFQYLPTDPEYDNNSHQLSFVGKTHYMAQNRQPSNERAFPGVVIVPQCSYNGAWGDQNVHIVINFLEWMIHEYSLDQDRIVIHGLSNGAKGVWKMASQRPDLFAAAIPMSGVGADLDFMTDILVTMPIWIFQGEEDTNPSPQYSRTWFEELDSNGGNVRYTLYEDTGHETWFKAYAEPDFFSWIRSQHKKKIHVLGGEDAEDPLQLGFSAGFTEYQWLRNDRVIPEATKRFVTAHHPGRYSVRFRRKTDGSWDESFALEVVYPDYVPLDAEAESELVVYPNPFTDQVTIRHAQPDAPVRLYDTAGKSILETTLEKETLDLSFLSPGIYLLVIGENRLRVLKK